jgi:hypothetical protein
MLRVPLWKFSMKIPVAIRSNVRPAHLKRKRIQGSFSSPRTSNTKMISESRRNVPPTSRNCHRSTGGVTRPRSQRCGMGKSNSRNGRPATRRRMSPVPFLLRDQFPLPSFLPASAGLGGGAGGGGKTGGELQLAQEPAHALQCLGELVGGRCVAAADVADAAVAEDIAGDDQDALFF